MRDLILKEVKKSAKEYEVYLQKTEINEVHIQKNKIGFIDKIIDSGYGIRVHDRGMGFSSSNIFSDFIIKQTIKNALKSSRLSQKVDFNFPTPKKFSKVKNIDKSIKDNGEACVKNYANKILKSIPKDILISFGKVRTYDSQIQIINSEDLEPKREETTFMLELSIIVEKSGKKVEFWPHEYKTRIKDLPVSNLKQWIKIARDQLVAVTPKTEITTVIFSPNSVLDGLGSIIGSHSSGAAKVNGISKFIPGEKVASENLTVISDGLYPYGLMTSEFDDEGVPQRKNILIDNGIYKDYVYDQFYAIKDNRESTGNGLRQGDTFYIFDVKYGGTPNNKISNFYVKPGKKNIQKLIGEVKHGILVNHFSWLAPDPTSGSFSSEIRAGYYIDNGQISKPIKGGLITGNFFEMMKNISGISNKSVITSGGSVLAGVCPYVRFENVQVAGK
jgi:predicted Zn-dependent protease